MKMAPVVKEWAELVAEYYRSLVRQEIPPKLIEKLVVDWQIHMLFLVKGADDEV